jgi:hypothetical protein
MTTVATDYEDPRDYGRAALLSETSTLIKRLQAPENKKMKKARTEMRKAARRLRFTRESAEKGVSRCAEPEPHARWAE